MVRSLFLRPAPRPYWLSLVRLARMPDSFIWKRALRLTKFLNCSKICCVIKILAATVLLLSSAVCGTPGDRLATEERLSFQCHSPYQPRLHLNADVAMVYGIDTTLPSRIETWRNAGYRIHVMTGVAWGQYQDYLNGKFDGVKHWDQAQMTRDGAPILHGKSADIP